LRLNVLAAHANAIAVRIPRSFGKNTISAALKRF
jgi:hypothetical protein